MQHSKNGEGSPQLPGLLYCLIIALVSHATGSLSEPLTPFILAIIYGVLISNMIRTPRSLVPGIKFCAYQLMEGTIAVMGFVTSISTLLYVSIGVLNSILIIFSTLVLSRWLGKRLNMSGNQATLIGVGMSICGSTAIVATAMRIEGSEEEIGVAMKCTALFGLISMLLYSLLFFIPLIRWLGVSPETYSVLVGSGIQETYQVMAAAGVLGFENIGPALVIKMFRVFMIGPAVLFIIRVLRPVKSMTSGPATIFYLPLYGSVFFSSLLLHAFLDACSLWSSSIGTSWNGLENALKETILPILLSMSLAGAGSIVNIQDLQRTKRNHIKFAAIITLAVGSIVLSLTLCMVKIAASLV